MLPFEFELACLSPSIFVAVWTFCAFFGMRVFFLFVGVFLYFVHSLGSRKECVHHLLNESWLRLEGVVYS